jgi:hypothetical protein
MTEIQQILQDSLVETREVFSNQNKKSISFPSNSVDAVVGFFQSRGFETTAAQSVASVLLTQAKVDGVNIMELLEDIKTLDRVKLSDLITAILNANRSKISKIGVKKINNSAENLTARNIIV